MPKKLTPQNDGIGGMPISPIASKNENSKIYLNFTRKVSIALSSYLNGSFALIVTFFMFFKPLLQQLRFIPILPLVGETANFLFHARKLLSAPLRIKLSVGPLVIISYLAATLAMTAGVLHGFGIGLLANILPFNPLLFAVSLGIHASLATIKFSKSLVDYIRFPEKRTQLKTLRLASRGIKATGMLTLTGVMIPLMMATGAVFIVGGLSNPFTAGPVAITLFSVFAVTCAVLVARKIIKTYIKHRLQEKTVQKYLANFAADQEPEDVITDKTVSASLRYLTKEILEKPRSRMLLRLARNINNPNTIMKNPITTLKVSSAGQPLKASRFWQLPGFLYIKYLWEKAKANDDQKDAVTDAYLILSNNFLYKTWIKSCNPSDSTREDESAYQPLESDEAKDAGVQAGQGLSTTAQLLASNDQRPRPASVMPPQEKTDSLPSTNSASNSETPNSLAGSSSTTPTIKQRRPSIDGPKPEDPKHSSSSSSDSYDASTVLPKSSPNVPCAHKRRNSAKLYTSDNQSCRVEAPTTEEEIRTEVEAESPAGKAGNTKRV